MSITILAVIASFSSYAACQSVQNLGSSGGTGPSGGIGDTYHPVLQAQSFVTDALYPAAPNTTRQLAKGEAPTLVKRIDSTCPVFRDVLVDSSPAGARQEVLGFGHAWTDSTISVLNSLEPAVFDQLMLDLFGQEGNNMGFMRHTIGSSDLSGVQYTYDDNGPSFNQGEPDESDLPNFDLGQYGRAMADMIGVMGQYKSDVFLYGSPWSYPGWMKNNGLFVAPNLLNGYNILNNSFDTRYTSHVVEYFSKYVDAFKERGVTVNGITLMNEPLNYQGGYPCMSLTSDEAAALLQGGLGKAMHDRNVTVIVYDHNTDQQIYPAHVIQNAPEYADAVGWHCYAGQWGDYSAVQMVNHAFGRPMLQFMTECSTTSPTATINFGVGYQLSRPIHYGASAASYWVMATNPEYGPHSPYGGCATCQGSVIVNSPTSYTLTNDYYLLGQFSRFIRRGGTNHVVLTGEQGVEGTFVNEFYIIAVQNPDNGWAVVFLNNLGRNETVRLRFTASDTVWEGTVPSETVTTWLLPSDRILRGNGTSATNTTATMSSPRYPLRNSTMAISSSTGTRASEYRLCTGTPSTSSPSSTFPPVPYGNRTIDWEPMYRL